jgi:putative CocE/NonD family hydrolase
VEDREDVVIYTSSVLAEDLTVVGEVVLQVHVGATARVADFAAKLVDVDLESRAMIVTEGVRRWRAAAATSLERPLRVRLGGTAHVFRRGHRVRLEIAGSNFPKYDRGPDLGPGQTISQWVVHDRDRPSFLSLPVVWAWQEAARDEVASGPGSVAQDVPSASDTSPAPARLRRQG